LRDRSDQGGPALHSHPPASTGSSGHAAVMRGDGAEATGLASVKCLGWRVAEDGEPVLDSFSGQALAGAGAFVASPASGS